MAGHEEVTHRFGIVHLEHIADGEEIAQGLGHLLSIYHHHTGMHPGVDVGGMVSTAALGNFVFMMGEHQIRTTAMNIEVVAQMTGIHGRAFDMPARTARPPGRLPGRLARLGHLPQHKVHGVTFALLHADPGAGLQLLQILTGEATILGVAVDGEEHIAIIRHIGVAIVQQLLHQRDDLGDM